MNPGDKIDALDHGFVRLVNSMGDDLSIVNAARVSYNKESISFDTKKDTKLIAYLLRNKHTSPFESVVFTFEIKCPIFIARQWHRHRTWSYNEVSARYTELPAEFYVPQLAHITTQSEDNKQMRTMEQHPAAEDIQEFIRDKCKECFAEYQRLIGLKTPRELARTILPLATYTRFFGTVNLHNLLHFLRLRLHPHAQWEIQRYAIAITQIINDIVPITTQHWLTTFGTSDIVEFEV